MKEKYINCQKIPQLRCFIIKTARRNFFFIVKWIDCHWKKMETALQPITLFAQAENMLQSDFLLWKKKKKNLLGMYTHTLIIKI